MSGGHVIIITGDPDVLPPVPVPDPDAPEGAVTVATKRVTVEQIRIRISAELTDKEAGAVVAKALAASAKIEAG